jgi:tRNA modification GTPase
MSAFAAVMTDKGTGAIATIQLLGESAEAVLKKIFKPTGSNLARFKAGKILLGTINEGNQTIDQVVIGCEADNCFAINCHGNPLIVEMIMQLLRRCGAELVTAEQLLAKSLHAQQTVNTIALEAKLMLPKTKTLAGAKIVANQIEAGLGKKVSEWLRDIKRNKKLKTKNSKLLCKAEAGQMLNNSVPARLIIAGCKAAIIGPPNTGKSTLLNCLSGRQKAIVTDIKGTTRDWVSAQCQIPPLALELIDTAGLDEQLAAASKDAIAKAAQKKSLEILEQADLVLLVLDNSQPASQLELHLVKKIAKKRVLTILNKSDLPCALDITELPQTLANTVQMSAKLGTGLEKLAEKIRQTCGVNNFDLRQPVCFSSRQENLLKKLNKVRSKSDAFSIVTELLDGPID